MFFCFFAFVAGDVIAGSDNQLLISTPKSLLVRLSKKELPAAKKLKAIELFSRLGLALDNETTYGLIQLLENSEKVLYNPILELISSCAQFHSLSPEKVEQLVTPLLLKKGQDVLIVEKLSWLVAYSFASVPGKRNDFEKRWNPLLLRVFSSNEPYFQYCLEKKPYRIPNNDPNIKRFILARLGKVEFADSAAKILTFIKNSNGILTSLEGNDLGKIVAVASSSDKLVSETASAIICKVAHLENPPIEGWKIWWKRNKNSFSVFDVAVDALRKSNGDGKAMFFASSQVENCVGDNFSKSNFEKLLRLVLDENADLKLRGRTYSVLYSIVYEKPDVIPYTKMRSELDMLSRKLVTNANFHELVFVFLASGSRINTVFWRAKAYSILNSPRMNNLSRSFAAFALGGLNHDKKKAALNILAFTKSLTSNTRPFRVALIALQKLTGKKHGTDLKAWRKAIEKMPKGK